MFKGYCRSARPWLVGPADSVHLSCDRVFLCIGAYKWVMMMMMRTTTLATWMHATKADNSCSLGRGQQEEQHPVGPELAALSVSTPTLDRSTAGQRRQTQRLLLNDCSQWVLSRRGRNNWGNVVGKTTTRLAELCERRRCGRGEKTNRTPCWQ